MEVVKECPKCPSYKAQLANSSEELKKKEESIERLKDEMNKLRAQLNKSKKVIRKAVVRYHGYLHKEKANMKGLVGDVHSCHRQPTRPEITESGFNPSSTLVQ